MATAVKAQTKHCVHHWLVRPPEGTTSWARCRKCGKRKRFSNSFQGQDRTNNSDIFVDNPVSWRPNWRSAAAPEPHVREAYEAARLTGWSAS